MKKRILTKGIIIIALNIICLFFSQLSLDAYEPFNLQFKNVVNDNFEITGPMYIPENEERFIRDGDLTVSATLQMNPNSTLLFEPGHQININDGQIWTSASGAKIIKTKLEGELIIWGRIFEDNKEGDWDALGLYDRTDADGYMCTKYGKCYKLIQSTPPPKPVGCQWWNTWVTHYGCGGANTVVYLKGDSYPYVGGGIVTYRETNPTVDGYKIRYSWAQGVNYCRWCKGSVYAVACFRRRQDSEDMCMQINKSCKCYRTGSESITEKIMCGDPPAYIYSDLRCSKTKP